jgi:pilus assembly protein Flp/PilA
MAEKKADCNAASLGSNHPRNEGYSKSIFWPELSSVDRSGSHIVTVTAGWLRPEVCPGPLLSSERIALMRNLITSFVKNEEGAALVEYGLLVGLIAVASIAGVTLLGTNIAAMFTAVAGAIPTG